MPQLLRVEVDVVVGDNVTRTQANELREMLTDYAGGVAAKKIFNRVITETQPGAGWHIHDGKVGCSHCERHAHDKKNSEDPRGEN